MSICWGSVVTASAFVGIYGLGHVTALVRSVGRARAMRAVEEEPTSTVQNRIEEPASSAPSASTLGTSARGTSTAKKHAWASHGFTFAIPRSRGVNAQNSAATGSSLCLSPVK
jgi:hypothetical protein